VFSVLLGSNSFAGREDLIAPDPDFTTEATEATEPDRKERVRIRLRNHQILRGLCALCGEIRPS